MVPFFCFFNFWRIPAVSAGFGLRNQIIESLGDFRYGFTPYLRGHLENGLP